MISSSSLIEHEELIRKDLIEIGASPEGVQIEQIRSGMQVEE